MFLSLSLQQIIVHISVSSNFSAFKVSYPQTNYAIGLPNGDYSISVLAVNEHSFSVEYPSNRVKLSVDAPSSNSGGLSDDVQVLEYPWLYILVPTLVHLGVRTIMIS